MHGLPYVPFRGVLLCRGDLTIIINEAGHFQAYYARDTLATEDMAKFHFCETGRGLNQLYKAGGQKPSIVENATVATDLWRAAAGTRKMHVGADGGKRSYKTATRYRRSMEAGEIDEPFVDIALLARIEHGWRLFFFRGFGATMERIRCYGVCM